MPAALSHEYGAETPDLKSHQKQLNEDKIRIRAEVSGLKLLVRLEDLSIFKVKKQTRKNKFLFYWFAAWTINNKAHNAYLRKLRKDGC